MTWPVKFSFTAVSMLMITNLIGTPCGTVMLLFGAAPAVDDAFGVLPLRDVGKTKAS